MRLYAVLEEESLNLRNLKQALRLSYRNALRFLSNQELTLALKLDDFTTGTQTSNASLIFCMNFKTARFGS